MNKDNSKVPPVNVGDLVEVKIISTGQKGDGVAKFEGFIIMIPGAKLDEDVKVEITRVLPRMAFGEIQ